MAAEVDVLCDAGYGEVTPERMNSRNGYRSRPFDTRVGSIELAIPKLRRGQLLPGLAAGAAPAGRAGAGGGGGRVLRAWCVAPDGSKGWCRRSGIEWLSKSQVSRMATELDARWRRSATGPSTAAPTPTCRWTP